MTLEELNEYSNNLRNRFIKGLIKFSNRTISLEEAKRLSITHLDQQIIFQEVQLYIKTLCTM